LLAERNGIFGLLIFLAEGRVARWFIFKPKNPKFGTALDWKILIYFMAIWNILGPFGIVYDLLVHFVFICYILCSFGTFSYYGIMYQETSGNPVRGLLEKNFSRCCRDMTVSKKIKSLFHTPISCE
jgi:hypothetical protein